MKFGPVPLSQAEGAVLAHAVKGTARMLRKAHVLTTMDIADLRQAGLDHVVAAVVGQDDMMEDDAALAVVRALSMAGIEPRPVSTGRVNLHAANAGVFTVSRMLVESVNAIDPAVTIATLPEFARVDAGQMVATVKIIPFAVEKRLMAAIADATRDRQAFAVHPFRPYRVGLIHTTLAGLKDSVIAKTQRLTAARLARSGSEIAVEIRAVHDIAPVADALRSIADAIDMVILFGASAMSDPDDVIPAAIRQAGGMVIRAGMPVDPGNLLVLGSLNGKPVIGAPGCARSPKENGFDWVLDRLVAGIDVTSTDIAAMGVGGLLMEIASRPQPREASRKANPARVEAIVMAAGQSRRMGGPNKLLADFGGKSLVRRTAERVLASRDAVVTVVVGHQAERVETALAGLDVKIVANPDYASGLAGSLKAGIRALPADIAGALIVLGDMPAVTTADIDRMVAVFQSRAGSTIVRASHAGKRGNPVILPRAVFPELMQLQGDTGARQIIESGEFPVVDVDIGAGAGIDVDTPEAVSEAGGVLQD